MWRTALHSVLAAVLPLMMMAMAVCAVLPSCPMMGSMTAGTQTEPEMGGHAGHQGMEHQASMPEATMGHCHSAPTPVEIATGEVPDPPADSGEMECCCELQPATPSTLVDVPVQLALFAALTLDTSEPLFDGAPSALPEMPPRPGPPIPLFTLHASLLI